MFTRDSDGVYSSYQADGSLVCWGIVDMAIPEGGSHVRQCGLSLPKFAGTPTVTTTIHSDKSPGTSFVVWNLTFNEDDPGVTFCKVSATNIERGVPVDYKFVCHFHAIGIPAT